MNASVRQAPSSRYEEREAVSQLSVCDFSSRAFAGASSWLGIGGVTFRYPHPQMLLMTLTPAHCCSWRGLEPKEVTFLPLHSLSEHFQAVSYYGASIIWGSTIKILLKKDATCSGSGGNAWSVVEKLGSHQTHPSSHSSKSFTRSWNPNWIWHLTFWHSNNLQVLLLLLPTHTHQRYCLWLLRKGGGTNVPTLIDCSGLLRCVLVQFTRTPSTPLNVQRSTWSPAFSGLQTLLFFFSAKSWQILGRQNQSDVAGGSKASHIRLHIFEGPAVKSHGTPTSCSLWTLYLLHLIMYDVYSILYMVSNVTTPNCPVSTSSFLLSRQVSIFCLKSTDRQRCSCCQDCAGTANQQGLSIGEEGGFKIFATWAHTHPPTDGPSYAK